MENFEKMLCSFDQKEILVSVSSIIVVGSPVRFFIFSTLYYYNIFNRKDYMTMQSLLNGGNKWCDYANVEFRSPDFVFYFKNKYNLCKNKINGENHIPDVPEVLSEFVILLLSALYKIFS